MVSLLNRFKSNSIFWMAPIVMLLGLQSCEDNDDKYVAVSPAVVDLTQVPYQNLSEYHFFEGDMKLQNPVYGVIPYRPASSLFTDYALKNALFGCQKTPKPPIILMPRF